MSKKRRRKTTPKKTDAELLAEAVEQLRTWRATYSQAVPTGSILGERLTALDLVLDAVVAGRTTPAPAPDGPPDYTTLRDTITRLNDYLHTPAGPRSIQHAIDVATSRGLPAGQRTPTTPTIETDDHGDPTEPLHLTPTEAAALHTDQAVLRATVTRQRARELTQAADELLSRLTETRHDRPTQACASCGTAIPHGRTRCQVADCQTSTTTRPETCIDCSKTFAAGEKTWHGRCNRCRMRKKRADDVGETYIPLNEQDPEHIANTQAIQLQDNVMIDADTGIYLGWGGPTTDQEPSEQAPEASDRR